MINLETMTEEKLHWNHYSPARAMDVKATEPVEPMPIKARPYTHQIIGYNMACRILVITKGGD